jgi:hypothetical protein
LQAKFNTLTNGGSMTAETLKQIYKVANIPVSDAEIDAQVKRILNNYRVIFF